MFKNLSESDFDEYYRVRLQALEQYPVAYSSMPKFFKECPREKHLDLLRDSGSDSNFFLKGYFEDEKLLGVIGMMPHSRESVDHKVTLWGFYVEPGSQGRGIGRILIEEFIKEAKSKDELTYIRLMVAVNCERAISLFRNVGFVEYGREKDAIKDDERVFYDQIYMQLSCVESNSVEPKVHA